MPHVVTGLAHSPLPGETVIFFGGDCTRGMGSSPPSRYMPPLRNCPRKWTPWGPKAAVGEAYPTASIGCPLAAGRVKMGVTMLV